MRPQSLASPADMKESRSRVFSVGHGNGAGVRTRSRVSRSQGTSTVAWFNQPQGRMPS